MLGPVDDAHPALAQLLAQRVLPEAARPRHALAETERHERGQRRQQDREDRPEERVRHRLAPRDFRRHALGVNHRCQNGCRCGGERRDPGGPVRRARNERGARQQDRDDDQEEEHLGPPRLRHVRRHARVEPEGSERPARVQETQHRFGEVPLAGGDPDEHEDRAGRKLEENVGPPQGPGRARDRRPERFDQEARDEEGERREERDARPERDSLAEEVAFAGRVERGRRHVGLGTAALENLTIRFAAHGYLLPLRASRRITDSRCGPPRAGRASAALILETRS